MKFLSALSAAGALLATGPALACYTVYDGQNRIVYQAQAAPVDMSRPLHETMPRAFPGGHLVFGDALDCQLQSPSRTFLQATSGKPPLLTDERTARALGLPHTIVAEGIALVPDRPDNMRPGVVLVESAPSATGPDTRAMGAAPAPPVNRRAAPAPRVPRVYERWEPAPRR